MQKNTFLKLNSYFILSVLFLLFISLVSCQQNSNDRDVTIIEWRGSFTDSEQISNPHKNDAYYNTEDGSSYIYDGKKWTLLAKAGNNGTNGQNGINGNTIVWRGSFANADEIENPQILNVYYNTTDGCSYIYDGDNWTLLAKAGADANNSNNSSEIDNPVTITNTLYINITTSQGNYIQYGSGNYSFSEVDFGQAGIGLSSKTKQFLLGITQLNSPTLNLTGNPPVQISGNDSDQFIITQPKASSTNSLTGIQDICIEFKPTSIGEKTATITIPNDSPDKPDFSFIIKGRGSFYPKIFDGGEGDGDDAVTKILTDSSNNMYAIGYGYELVNSHSGYDWWIKKFNSIGVEQWEAKFDFYEGDDSQKKDTPKFALIDNAGNLIVSSDYNTVKLNQSGIKEWSLDIGGEIFCDSNNNIVIDESIDAGIYYTNPKYSTTGDLLWKSKLLRHPIFDSANNIYSLAGSSVTKINSDGTFTWSTASLDSTGRYNGFINDFSNQCLSYPVISGNKYLITWDDKDGTTLDKKTSCLWVSGKYETSQSYEFLRESTGYGTRAKKIQATKSDNFFIELDPTTSSLPSYTGIYTNDGTYAIAMYQNYTSGSDFSSSDWVSSSLSSNGSMTYYLSVTKGRPYIICSNDKSYGDASKTGRISLSAKYSDGTSIISNKSSNYNNPEIFFANQTGTVSITVKTYSSSSSDAGTYSIVYKALPYIQPKICGFETGMQNTVSICIDSEDNIYVAGYEDNKVDTYSKKDIIIKKFSSNGTEITSGWNKVIDYGHCDDEIPEKILYNGSHIIMIGKGNDSISGSSALDGLFYIFEPSGSLVSSFELDSLMLPIFIDNSNNFYFETQTLYKYTSTGSLEWQKDLGSGISNPEVSIDNISIYIGGYGNNLVSKNSNKDWYIKKYSLDGIEQ